MKTALEKIKTASTLTGQDKKILLWCFGVVSLWRIGLEFINQSIVLMNPGLRPDLKGIGHGAYRWMFWDGGWYNLIIQKGYVNLGQTEFPISVAFFPGFPTLVKLVDVITPFSYVFTALIVNFLLTVGIAFFTYKLCIIFSKGRKATDGQLAAKWAVVLLLAFPASLFFAAFYADALLVLATSAAIYFALTKKYIVAGAFIGLATLTKSIGLILVPVLILIMLEQNKSSLLKFVKTRWAEVLLSLTLSISGLLLYMAYLQVKFNNAFLFLEAQKYWDRAVNGFFLERIWEVHIRNIFHPSYYGNRFNHSIEILMVLLMFSVLIIGLVLIARRRFWLGVLCLLTILLPISTGRLTSLNRYVLLLTPLLAFLVVKLSRYKISTVLFTSLAFFSTLLLIYFTTGFLQGTYFAG